jgi:hypothetical protein
MRRILGNLANTDQGAVQYIWKAILISLVPATVISITITLLAVTLFPQTERPFTDTSPGESAIALFGYLVVVAPWVETFLMWPVFGFLRLFSSNTKYLVVVSALIWSLYHSWATPLHGLIVFWGFVVLSLSFVEWQRRSTKKAIAVTACIHMCHNIIPAMAVALMAAGYWD